MVPDDDAERRADQLAEDAAALLDQLDQDDPPPRGVARLDPTRLGRIILWIGGASALALAGATTAIVLVLVQVSTRADVIQAAVEQAVTEVRQQQAELAAAQEATRQSDCDLISLFRAVPGEPPPAPGRGELIAGKVETAYQTRGCDQP